MKATTKYCVYLAQLVSRREPIVSLIQGPALSGKTTLLCEAAVTLARARVQVRIVCTNPQRARYYESLIPQRLLNDSHIQCTTLDQLLTMRHVGEYTALLVDDVAYTYSSTISELATITRASDSALILAYDTAYAQLAEQHLPDDLHVDSAITLDDTKHVAQRVNEILDTDLNLYYGETHKRFVTKHGDKIVRHNYSLQAVYDAIIKLPNTAQYAPYLVTPTLVAKQALDDNILSDMYAGPQHLLCPNMPYMITSSSDASSLPEGSIITSTGRVAPYEATLVYTLARQHGFTLLTKLLREHSLVTVTATLPSNVTTLALVNPNRVQQATNASSEQITFDHTVAEQLAALADICGVQPCAYVTLQPFAVATPAELTPAICSQQPLVILEEDELTPLTVYSLIACNPRKLIVTNNNNTNNQQWEETLS